MRNIPLVLLGVVFTVLTTPLLLLLDGKALASVIAAIVLVSGTIDAINAGARKKLDDIMAIKSFTGKRLIEIAEKVKHWKSLFDVHLLLSIALKVCLAICGALAAAISSPHFTFGVAVAAMSITFGLLSLLTQNFLFSRHIESFLDRKTVEGRNLATCQEEAKLIGADPAPPKRKQKTSASPERAYQRIILKA